MLITNLKHFRVTMSKTMSGEPDYKDLDLLDPSYGYHGYRSLQEETADVRLHQHIWNSEARTLKCYGYCSMLTFVFCVLLLVAMSTIGIVMSLTQAEGGGGDVTTRSISVVNESGGIFEQWNITTTTVVS